MATILKFIMFFAFFMYVNCTIEGARASWFKFCIAVCLLLTADDLIEMFCV